MTKVQIIALNRDRAAVLADLHAMRCVHLVEERSEEAHTRRADTELTHASRLEDLRLTAMELEGVLDLLDATGDREFRTPPNRAPVPFDLDATRKDVNVLAESAGALTGTLDALHAEQVVLQRYLTPLRRLLPLVPELASLTESELAALGIDVTALVLRGVDDKTVETLRHELVAALGSRFELVAARVDVQEIGCVLVFEHATTSPVHTLLNQLHVRQQPLPQDYKGLSLVGAVNAMERRLRAIPIELDRALAELRSLLQPHGEHLARWHAAALDELEQLEAVSLLGSTERAFVVAGWLPRAQMPRLRADLEQSVRAGMVIAEVPTKQHDPSAPVLMHNPAPARPFESLVRFLDLPRAGTTDPTPLVALFVPLMLGVMIGDVVYGLLLLLAAALARRRYRAKAAIVGDITYALMVGAGWAVVFGFLFGEALGSLGKTLGMPALWFYRGGVDAVEPLLLFAFAIGVTHVVLGICIGLWQAWRLQLPRLVLDRLGTLLVLCAVFAFAGITADMLPSVAATPVAGAAIAGLMLMMATHGLAGVFMAPLELLGTLGNLLSYLRLGAVGLASAYLAITANELAVVGPLWIGIVVATLLHGLNLTLAAFTPTVQALRLHYVEFFPKFYVGGGQPFRPFGERTPRRRQATPALRRAGLAITP